MCTPDGVHLCTWNLDVNKSLGQSMQYNRKRRAVNSLDSQLYSKGRFFFIDWHPPSLPRQFVQLVTSLGSGRMAPLEPVRRNRHKRICRWTKASQAFFCNYGPLEVRIDETNRMSLSSVTRLLSTPDILTHLHERTRLFHPFFCITQPFSSSQRLCYLQPFGRLRCGQVTLSGSNSLPFLDRRHPLYHSQCLVSSFYSVAFLYKQQP